MQDIVNLYRQHSKYDNLSDAELRLYLMPSINLKQCKLHYDGEELIGFTNWAFLSDKVQAKFKKEGSLQKNEWLCGNNIWHIETICKKNLKQIINWTKRYFAEIYGVGKLINWLRVDHNSNIRNVVKIHTRGSWL
jgi:hemolysin-activating ACP:hemolysin acyltransferase